MMMNRFYRLAALALALGVAPALGGCQATDEARNKGEDSTVRGQVTDVEAFRAFVAQRPTAEQFRARYPDVQLVMPDDIVTKEYRMDNSRFFPEWDEDGRIVGGKFM